ncbi:MAG: hypothetical protein WAL56_01405 [Candidatus Sulfotelmatobacter sp.]
MRRVFCDAIIRAFGSYPYPTCSAVTVPIPTMELVHPTPRLPSLPHPRAFAFPANPHTLKIVKRLYTIGRIKGGMKFTCTHCAHHVSTLDFDARDGNLRTQAATAINQHATNVHHEPVMFSSLDAQQHIYRA